MTELATRTISGRVSETELEKEFKIDKKEKNEAIFVKTVSEKVITYAMPTDEFMKHAVIVENE